MAIVDKLRKMIRARGGQTIGVHTIEDGVNALDKIDEKITNVLKDLTIDADIGASVDLLGKYVDDLQENIVIDDFHGRVTGTLKYVTDYTGFSGDPAEQEGNYIALHAEVPDVTGVTIKCKTRPNKVFDVDPSDGLIVLFIKGIDNRYLEFTAYKDGCTPVTKKYDISGLTITPAPEPDEGEEAEEVVDS